MAAAVERLRAWNREANAERPEPLVFNAWLRELGREVYADELGSLFHDAWELRPLFLRNVLHDVDGQARWCDRIDTPAQEDCAEIAGRALDAALADLRQRYGKDPWQLRWGEAHAALLEHRPFGRHPQLSKLYDIRRDSPGDAHTVNVGRNRVNDLQQPYANRHAASLRAIYDLGVAERSRFIHASGQSGDRASAYYSDFANRWARGEYLTLHMREQDYEAEQLGRLRLTPRKRQ